jgi:fumarylacetoacetase
MLTVNITYPPTNRSNLNAFMALGKPEWTRVRTRLQALLSGSDPALTEAVQAQVCVPVADVAMQLPATIGDYTDCYASRNHAVNVGTMFRGKDNALMPNWTHLPVAYHGRASSIVVSGTDARRPCGQVKATPDAEVKYMPDPRVDFELEVAVFVGKGNTWGSPMSVKEAKDKFCDKGIGVASGVFFFFFFFFFFFVFQKN